MQGFVDDSSDKGAFIGLFPSSTWSFTPAPGFVGEFKVFVSKFVFVAEMRGDRDTWRGFRQLSSLIQGLSQSSQGE